MQAVDIIGKKRDGIALSRDEIDFFVRGLTTGEIPDYQVSAWAMAVLLNGMSVRETTDLTLAMAHSGSILDLSDIVGVVVDKHSTGGVGDKTTLVVLPVVAACGLPIGKMSGRGLGFSGGTLDKMESIPGFFVNLSIDDFKRQLKQIGIVLAGQSVELAPADGILYALRDVTGTVPSLPLIASSIMSKKIAAGAQVIVLDVKIGHGAFMKTLPEARKLASWMEKIGTKAGCRVITLLSDMNQPLGSAVGNALEVREAIDTLHGGGPADLQEHCLTVAAHMLVQGGLASDLEAGWVLARRSLQDNSAYDRFRALVSAQGGDSAFVDHPDRLPRARLVQVVNADRDGCLCQIQAGMIGEAAVLLGAGRAKKGDPIDHSVGLEILHKVGDRVKSGQPLFVVHANDPASLAAAREKVSAAHVFNRKPVPPLPLFYPG